MDIPSPKTWTPGLWSAADMNVHMRDTLEFFLDPPLCIVRKDERSQAVGKSEAFDSIEWDTVVHDNDGMFDSSAADRLTCRTPGYYLLTTQMQFQRKDAAQEWREIFAYKYNSSGTIIDNNFPLDEFTRTEDESYCSSVILPMNAGDYLRYEIFKWGLVEDLLVNYDPSSGYYGNQISLRWISAL